jgi:hypothetical protein
MRGACPDVRALMVSARLGRSILTIVFESIKEV